MEVLESISKYNFGNFNQMTNILLIDKLENSSLSVDTQGVSQEIYYYNKYDKTYYAGSRTNYSYLYNRTYYVGLYYQSAYGYIDVKYVSRTHNEVVTGMGNVHYSSLAIFNNSRASYVVYDASGTALYRENYLKPTYYYREYTAPGYSSLIGVPITTTGTMVYYYYNTGYVYSIWQGVVYTIFSYYYGTVNSGSTTNTRLLNGSGSCKLYLVNMNDYTKQYYYKQSIMYYNYYRYSYIASYTRYYGYYAYKASGYNYSIYYNRTYVRV